MLIAMPEQPLDPFQFDQQPSTRGLVVVGDTPGILFQYCQAHRDVEPVKDVLGCRSDELSQRPDFFAAVCQEGDVLVRLQTLALEYVKEPTLWLAVVAMRQTNVAGVSIFGHRLPDNELEVRLPVLPVADIAAIKADHDASFRDGQLGPIRRAAINEAGPLFAKFGFGTLGHM